MQTFRSTSPVQKRYLRWVFGLVFLGSSELALMFERTPLGSKLWTQMSVQ